MEISEGTIQVIVNRVVEEVITQMPTIIGNMMKHHATMNRLNYNFYKENPEFQKHKDVVVSVVEQIESGDITLKYEDILKKAAPVIKDRIGQIAKVDVSTELSLSTPSKVTKEFMDNGVL